MGSFAISAWLCWATIDQSTSFQNMSIAFISTVVIAVISAFWISSYNISKTLFLLLIYAQAFIIAITLAAFISQRFFESSSACAMFSRTIMHIGIVLLCAMLQKKFKLFTDVIDHGWWSLNFVEVLCFCYTSFFVLRVYDKPYGTTDLIVFLLFLLIIIAVYVVFFQTIRYMHIASEQQKVALQSQFMLEQMNVMQEATDEAKRLRHDSRHHNLQILEYIKSGKTEAAIQYLSEYEQEAESHKIINLCENVAANSILCAYARKAERNGITVNFDVSIEKDIGISNIDIVAILSNLMENAIHGCHISVWPGPLIDVYIGRKSGKMVIYVSNTTEVDVILENGLPQSKDGVGIASVLYSASKYGGEFDFQSENGVFSCQILLKIPEKSTVQLH